jgi:hypothetical protein
MDTRKDSSADLAGLRSWTFITSHAQVLLAVARDPALRVEEIAKAARISERSAYRILADLQVADEPLRELIALVAPGVTHPVALENLTAALRSPLTSRRP